MRDLVLPELGENIETATVAQVLVRAGDRVRKDQPVLEVETEKATLEVPATDDGTVREVLVRAGEKIRVGAVILRLDGAAAEGRAEHPAVEEPEQVEVGAGTAP